MTRLHLPGPNNEDSLKKCKGKHETRKLVSCQVPFHRVKCHFISHISNRLLLFLAIDIVPLETRLGSFTVTSKLHALKMDFARSCNVLQRCLTLGLTSGTHFLATIYCSVYTLDKSNIIQISSAFGQYSLCRLSGLSVCQVPVDDTHHLIQTFLASFRFGQ